MIVAQQCPFSSLTNVMVHVLKERYCISFVNRISYVSKCCLSVSVQIACLVFIMTISCYIFIKIEESVVDFNLYGCLILLVIASTESSLPHPSLCTNLVGLLLIALLPKCILPEYVNVLCSC